MEYPVNERERGGARWAPLDVRMGWLLAIIKQNEQGTHSLPLPASSKLADSTFGCTPHLDSSRGMEYSLRLCSITPNGVKASPLASSQFHRFRKHRSLRVSWFSQTGGLHKNCDKHPCEETGSGGDNDSSRFIDHRAQILTACRLRMGFQRLLALPHLHDI